MDWKTIIATASDTQTLARAKSALGKHTIYSSPGDHVGKASDPVLPFPKHLDCSGFICYSIGIPRQLPPGSDKWLSTDEIWAHGEPTLSGLFPTSDGVQPGDLLVYPDYKVNGKKHDGHVGIVTEVANHKATKTIHCSHGNFTRTGDAVQITGIEYLYLRDNYRIVRPDYQRLRSAFGVASPSPRLILGIRDTTKPDGYRYQPIASAKLVDGSFEVDPKELADILHKAVPAGVPHSLRGVLSMLVHDFTATTDHMNDAEDPRVYVFVKS